MNEDDCCKGCYDHIWGCSECPYAEEHEADHEYFERQYKEAARLRAIEEAVSVFGEEAR